METKDQKRDEKDSKAVEYEEIKYYAGSLSRDDHHRRFRVNFRVEEKVTGDKSFAFGKHKGEEKAREAAVSYLKSMSDELELTKIQRVKKLTSEEQQYMAGVVDGDSCIYVTNDGWLRFELSQSSYNDKPPPILIAFKDAFGGSVNGPYERKREGKYGPHKPEYQYLLCSKKCKPILELISKHGIIKAPQALLGLECIKRDTRNEFSEFMELSKEDKKYFHKEFKKAKEEYDLVPIDNSRITNAWLSGFWTAEGCIGYIKENNIYVSFTQHGCLNILDEINEKLDNNGYIHNGNLSFYGQNILPVISKIEPFLIEKKDQIILARDHLKLIANRKKRVRTEEEKKYDIKKAKECASLKRLKVSIEK